MKEPKFDIELAAHNVATILTKQSINEIEAEQLRIQPTIGLAEFDKYGKKYAYIYQGYYKAAYAHFNGDLNEDF